MQAYGTDRLRRGKGDQLILFSIRSKGWAARVEKTLTTARHPGTAVLWDEKFFEVVAADPAPNGGVRYVLEAWRDEHVIRVSERYDQPSEAQREADYRAAIARERNRKSANIAGLFTGLLPAVVQEHLGSELGVLPAKLTALSTIPPMIFTGWIVNDAVRRYMNNEPGAPMMVAGLAMYFLVESAIRLQVAWFHRRPLGSAVGFVAYVVYWLATGRRSVSPFLERRGEKLYFTKPTEDVALRDAFTLREPLLTLLSPGEQNALAQRFGYEYRKQATAMAVIILIVSLVGVVSSIASMPRFSALLSLVVAGGLALEQIVRLPALRRGPAGSVLGFLVRPFARKLFA